MWQRILSRLFPGANPGEEAVSTAESAPVQAVDACPSTATGSNDDEESDLEEAGPSAGEAPWPPGMSIDAFVERQIEGARRRGRFKDLPGSGKPLPGLEHHDPDWWVRRKLAEEGATLPLSPALELRRDLPLVLERVKGLQSESLVRTELDAFNVRIRKVNSHHVAGPSSNLIPLDIEACVREWREARAGRHSR